MVCTPCQRDKHTACMGKLWCDCQHDTDDLAPQDVPLAWGNALRGPA